MSQHTPGYWKISGNDRRVIIGENTGVPICRVIGWDDGSDRARVEANARLITAAPDLLAALKEILRVNPVYHGKPVGAPWSVAREEQDEQIVAEDAAIAAIAKAEGR